MTENVEPGAILATSEEYLPGDGIYDDGEHLRSAAFGVPEVDPKDMTIHVRPQRTVGTVAVGDVVLGQVSYTKADLASVTILGVRGKGGSVYTPSEGTLHVSKVDNRYINDMAEVIRVGDIIRAKVTGLKGGPQLTTGEPDLGVLRAFSPENARQPLARAGWEELADPITGKTLTRKLAVDYGSGQL